MSAERRNDQRLLTRRTLRFFDELATSFDPIVVGIAGQGETVASLGEKISAETDLLIRRFVGRF